MFPPSYTHFRTERCTSICNIRVKNNFCLKTPKLHLNMSPQVSWIRASDLRILTIGALSYTQDKRFSAIHEEGSEAWILKITRAEVEDSGDYECQVKREPENRKFRVRTIDCTYR